VKKINILIQISATIFCLYIFIITAITPRSSIGLLQCFKLSNSQERQGCQTIILVKQTIDQLQKEINNIKRKTSNTQKIMTKIEEKKQEIRLIKKKFEIEPLEIEKKLLEKEQEQISYKIYGLAAESYKKLNKLYAQITENREIKEIIKEIYRLKQEVQKKIQNTAKEIQQIGKKIVQQTKIIQSELNKFKREKLIPIEQKLTTSLLAREVDQELDKVEIQIIELNEALTKELSTTLIPRDHAQIIQLENTVKRLKIMLKSISNPEKLLDLTGKKIFDLFDLSLIDTTFP